MRSGRKLQCHHYLGQEIPGLSRQPDGRWRVWAGGKQIATYQNFGRASDKSKKRAIKNFQSLINFTGAKTLTDLTTEKLMNFRKTIEEKFTDGGYKKWYYGTLKTVVSNGLENGLDADQIRAALDRMKVLWTASRVTAGNPTPISPEDLHLLLKHADPTWRAMILVGLNCCLHMEEVLALEWSTLNLKNKTYSTIRFKTIENRIPRAAVLWDETIEAINALPRKHPVYVFTSFHGTRFTRNTRGNRFALLREKAGVDKAVTFDWLKDGAYTAAINEPKVEERFARVLAGHRSTGDQDRYVLRNPKCVAGACLAVYQHYFG